MKNTQQTLRTLFDFQRFEPNARLSSLIAETEQRLKQNAIPDADLSRVAAAGDPFEQQAKQTAETTPDQP